jgi:orotate phosphoribosyltransferase
MGFLQEIAGRVEEVAAAGGKFADAFVRTAGATVAGALVFVEREIGYAQRAAKKRPKSDEANPKGRRRDEK